MADLLEKARAGRTKALENRAEIPLADVSPAKRDKSLCMKSPRSKSVPLFISSRSRAAKVDYAICKSKADLHQTHKSNFISIHTMPSPSAHLH